MLSDPTFDQLKSRMARLLRFAEPFYQMVYRSSTPKYATSIDLLTGEGSRQFGGRWNPVGISVVYAALTPETAMAETLAHYRYFGIPIEDAMPRTFVAISAQLKRVVDFRRGNIRQRLVVSLERILKEDWRNMPSGSMPITQRNGLAASQTGLEGLIVPSASGQHGHNLVVFPQNLGKSSRIAVMHPDKL